MRFIFLLLMMPLSFYCFGQPTPEYEYLDRYAHPRKSNFGLQFNFGFAGIDGSNCKFSEPNKQNNFINPRIGLGLNYQYTHYISLLFRASYFRTHCSATAVENDGILGDNFDGTVSIKHYLYPVRGYDEYVRRLNFYALAGVGAIYVNPKDAITEKPLADNMNFNSWSIMAPLGLGAELKLSDFFLMGLELNYVFTNSEYLDGSPGPVNALQQKKDNFASLGVNVTYIIPNKDFIYDKFLRFKKKER